MPFLKPQKEKPAQWKRWEERTNREGYRGAVFGSSNKQKYVGWFHNNVKSGKGFQSYEDANGFRTFYEGDWENDKRHGHGSLSFDCEATKKTLRIYSGSWKNDVMFGSGMKSFADGGLYKGDFKNGMRHGTGIMYYPNGNIYTGEWYKDQRHGIGRLVHGGRYYEGSFKKDTKCGLGKFYHLTTGQLQEGLWYDDLPQVTVIFDDPSYKSTDPTEEKFAIPPLTMLRNPRQVYLKRAYEILEQVDTFASGSHKNASKSENTVEK